MEKVMQRSNQFSRRPSNHDLVVRPEVENSLATRHDSMAPTSPGVHARHLMYRSPTEELHVLEISGSHIHELPVELLNANVRISRQVRPVSGRPHALLHRLSQVLMALAMVLTAVVALVLAFKAHP